MESRGNLNDIARALQVFIDTCREAGDKVEFMSRIICINNIIYRMYKPILFGFHAMERITEHHK
ncbi:hypothetical protein IEQ_04960 [Bacillus cereus BAG6X1-2]|nr:hypothetical protein IEQ_04960 [Bacillus cereus BAG6X1-2]